MGEWVRKTGVLWTYHLAGAPRPYGYVVQYRDAGRADEDWDAIVTAGGLDADVTLAERVSFDVARAAIETQAKQQDDE